MKVTLLAGTIAETGEMHVVDLLKNVVVKPGGEVYVMRNTQFAEGNIARIMYLHK